jgi:hypothetical protein
MCIQNQLVYLYILATRRVPADVAVPTIYAHANSGGGEGSDAIIAALCAGTSAGKKEIKIKIERAKGARSPSGGPLLPPSSMFSFVRRRPTTSGVVGAVTR